MSVSGDGAAIPPSAAAAQRPQTNGGAPGKRAKSPMGVRLDDIKWTLISAWLALFILAFWTSQWMFCFVLGLAITAFGLARLGFVRSLPDPLPATPAVASPAMEGAPSSRAAVARPDYAPSDIVCRIRRSLSNRTRHSRFE